LHSASVLAALSAGCLLTGCGRSTARAPSAFDSAAEREWIANATQLVRTLDTDIGLSTAGGANLAAARRALASQSAVYTMVVAYSEFGDCAHELGNAGNPASRDEKAADEIAGACTRLEQASGLFERATSHHDAEALLHATREALDTEPLVVAAETALAALRPA
jgi:hypothetical protein